MSDPIGRQLILQLVLIALNAFFASSEIAVISMNSNKLQRMAEDGDKAAAKMLKMSREPTGFLSTIQVGITLAGFLASAFAADSFSDKIVTFFVENLKITSVSEKLLDAVSVILITIILSFFMLVFGELVPKRVAMQKPYEIAKFSVPIITVIAFVMKPIVFLLSKTTNGILRLLRIKNEPNEENVTEEEIRLMVDIGEERGTIESGEKEMIENIFDFGDTTAYDIMTHRVDIVSIRSDESDIEILKIINESGLSRFPVYDETVDDIKGILNAREYFLNVNSNHKKPLCELLREPYFVPESIHADVLFKDMQKSKHHIAVVLDEYGATSGILTMEDLLEEIVGNIYDEYDPQDEAEITKISDNVWEVLGSLDIDTLCENLDVEFPEDIDFDTVGGLVFSQLNIIPSDGVPIDIEAYGLKIHIDSLCERRVDKARIEVLREKDEDVQDK